MENLCRILENVPEGLKLYSPICGEVTLEYVYDDSIDVRNTHKIEEWNFDEFGRIDEHGDCLLWPSKDNRNWKNWQKEIIPQCVGNVIASKFSMTEYMWIVTKTGMFAVNVTRTELPTFYTFEEYEMSEYLRFATPQETEHFFKVLDKQGWKFENGEVIKKSRCEKCGAYNNTVLCSSLDCQKYASDNKTENNPKYYSLFELKNKDYVWDPLTDAIFIFEGYEKRDDEYAIYKYACCFSNDKVLRPNKEIPYCYISNESANLKRFRKATKEEIGELTSKIADAGYVWDADSGSFIFLKNDITDSVSDVEEKQKFTVNDFKPFDKVLVRDEDDLYWRIEIFSDFDKGDYYPYKCFINSYVQCLPYNDETAHLLGTTENYEGPYKTW